MSSQASQFSSSPGGAASNGYWFDSLPRMVATSDIVVLGTVVDIRKFTRGTPPEETQLLRADLDVHEILYGSADVPSTLTVQTLALVAPQPDWRAIGNTVLAFMKLSTEPDAVGIYYPVNDQSVYLVAGTDVQETVEDDPFSQGVAAMTIDEIRSKIEQAAEDITAGKVKPQPPVFG